MDARLEKLKALGCNTDEALERFVGDEELYLTCLDEMLADAQLDKLGEALEAGDCDNAFHYAHYLKGVYGNMGITQAYRDCAEMTEVLRRNDLGEQLLLTYRRVRELIENIKAI